MVSKVLQEEEEAIGEVLQSALPPPNASVIAISVAAAAMTLLSTSNAEFEYLSYPAARRRGDGQSGGAMCC